MNNSYNHNQLKRVEARILLIMFVILLVLIGVFTMTDNMHAVGALLGIYFVFTILYFMVIKKKYNISNKENEVNDMHENVNFKLGYKNGEVEFKVKEENLISVIHQNEITLERTGREAVEYALDNPIGAPDISEVVSSNDKIVIVTSDVTRPMPSKEVLPILIDRLEKAGVNLDNVTVVFALGSHRKQTDEERKKLVGEEVYAKVKCVDSDPDDCINLGTTSAGTPIDITRVVAEADKLICLGNIEYHYFAGYSGGAKALMPGVASRETIQANHSAMIKADAYAGNVNSPVRLDLEESVQKRNIDYILNVILDQDKNIIHAVAGHYIKAHREGCRYLDKVYGSEIDQQADIVISTPGGYPKDLNVYQSQKALDNAKNAVRAGGIIILVASCFEGLGEGVFEKWINEANTAQDLIDRVKVKFELGGHKAAAIALVMNKADVYLVSDLDDAIVKNMFMTPFKTVDDALNAAYNKLGNEAKIIIMPHGSSTLVNYNK